MPRPPPQSFLLRLWREQTDAPLRATLITVGQPEQQRHFADLEALCAFLRAQANQEPLLNEAWDATYCTPSESS
jgi:hypothetical protein